MKEEKEPASFREQVKAKGRVVQTLVDIAVISGYGMGYIKAHTDPVLSAVGDKIQSLMPESIAMMGHAYYHSKKASKSEESVRMAGRAARRAWDRGKDAMKGAFA